MMMMESTLMSPPSSALQTSPAQKVNRYYDSSFNCNNNNSQHAHIIDNEKNSQYYHYHHHRSKNKGDYCYTDDYNNEIMVMMTKIRELNHRLLLRNSNNNGNNMMMELDLDRFNCALTSLSSLASFVQEQQKSVQDYLFNGGFVERYINAECVEIKNGTSALSSTQCSRNDANNKKQQQQQQEHKDMLPGAEIVSDASSSSISSRSSCCSLISEDAQMTTTTLQLQSETELGRGGGAKVEEETSMQYERIFQSLFELSKLRSIKMNFPHPKIQHALAISLRNSNHLTRLEMEVPGMNWNTFITNAFINTSEITRNQSWNKNPKNKLQELDLTGNDVGISGCKALGNVLRNQQCSLRALFLVDCNMNDEQCYVELASGIVGNTTLTKLDLSENHVGDKGCIALCDAWLRCDSDSTDAAAMKRNRTKTTNNNDRNNNIGLKRLELENTNLGLQACNALAKMLRSNNTSLTSLNLSENLKIGDTGCKALMCKGLKYNSTLSNLELEDCNITNKGLNAIGEVLSLPSCTITNLNLANNNLNSNSGAATEESFFDGFTNDEIQNIKKSMQILQKNNYNNQANNTTMNPYDSSLSIWDWINGNNNINDRNEEVTETSISSSASNDSSFYTAVTLSRSISIESLSDDDDDSTSTSSATSINSSSDGDLDNNGGSYYNSKHLKTSNTSSSKVVGEMSSFANALRVNRLLVTLNLDNNYISDEACVVLAKAIGQNIDSVLQHLDLENNQIGDTGCKALADLILLPNDNSPTTTKQAKLKSLNLCNNNIGDIGCVAIAEALKTNRTITSLNLSNNVNITDAIGCKSIAQTLVSNKNVVVQNIRINSNNIDNNGNINIINTTTAVADYYYNDHDDYYYNYDDDDIDCDNGTPPIPPRSCSHRAYSSSSTIGGHNLLLLQQHPDSHMNGSTTTLLSAINQQKVQFHCMLNRIGRSRVVSLLHNSSFNKSIITGSNSGLNDARDHEYYHHRKQYIHIMIDIMMNNNNNDNFYSSQHLLKNETIHLSCWYYFLRMKPSSWIAGITK